VEKVEQGEMTNPQERLKKFGFKVPDCEEESH
jgi:hypothetical protein